jgi:WD40 repeat protein
MLARFQIEASAVARLQHPNIVQIFEVGRFDGRPFIALELVAGGTLAEKLGTPWPAASAAHFVEQLARAIHFAHERGIVHRDLKPANILLANSGMVTGNDRIAFTRHTSHHSLFSMSQPKIADFGLAKLLDDEPTTNTNGWQTRVGVVLGSPPYMAPEQAAGRTQDIGPATDIHALGMILYEMLTCRPPFRGTSLLETLEQVKTQVPLPPSKLLPGIDGEMDAICLKCLEKNPKRRYPTAEALAEALSRFRKSLEKRSHPASILFVNRPRPLSVVALQVMLAVISALASGVTVWQVFRAGKDTHPESTQLQKGHENISNKVESPASPDDRKHQTSAQSSFLAFDRGLACCDRGEIDLGLLWLARGLKEAPVEDQQLQRLIRANLSSWRTKLNALQFSYPHPGQVENVGFSADGKIAFTLCHVRSSATDQHSEVRFWNLTTGRQVSEPFVRKEPVTTVALSPDGKAIILAGPGSAAWLVDVPTGQAIGSPLQHKAEITFVAFSNNSQTALTGSADHTAQLWNAKNGQPTGPHLQHPGAVTAVAFSPDGRIAATASADGTVHLWDTGTGQSKGFQMKQDAAVRALAFNANGHMLLTGGDDRSARLWDAATGRPIGQPRVHADRVLAVAFSPDGMRFATASADRTARIWDTVNVKQPMTLSHASAVKSVQFSPDGQKLLTVSLDFTAQIWGSNTGKRLGSALSRGDKVITAILSPDGTRILTGNQDGAKFWEIGGGSQVSPPLHHRARISAISFSPNSQSVLTASWDGTGRIWNAKTGEPIGLPLEHSGTIQSAAFGPDGGTVVTGGGALDKTARLWDARTGRPLCPPLIHPCGVTAVDFSPDGKTVLTIGADRKVRLWSVSNPSLGPTEQLANEKGHASRNDSTMVRSTDGSMVLKSDQRETARLWDVATSTPIGPRLLHSGSVSALAFSPDGRMMATGDSEGTVQLWKVPEPMTGDADQIVSWVEHVTGMKIDSNRESKSEELIAVHSQDN